ncbi:MAG: polysaccharide biosynthesis tyrosine autokinase [Bacteroidota bacterium]|nr:polysaccharide biosynthesis tyrosine autokinase [Bacteroidota bacterium]
MKFDSKNDLIQQEEAINYKKIIYQLLSHWYWLLLFGALGLGGAYTYLQFKKPIFSISSTILIPEESKGFDMKELFDVGLEQGYTKIYNQIEILKSSYTIKETLLRLNWRTSWYKKNIFRWNGVYKSEPYDVQEPRNFINPAGIKIYITPATGNFFTVSVDGKLNYRGEKMDVKFDDKGEFGRPFKNGYFNFTLLKKVNNFDSSGEQYYFVFNDLKQTTRVYQNRLNATLKDEFSDIVVCTIAGEEPGKESDFMNELIEVYIAQKMDLQNEAQRRSLEFINAQLSGISDSLDIAGDKFTEFRSKNTIIDLGAEGNLVMNNLKEIESERAKSQIQLDYFQDVLSYLEESGDLTKIVSPSVVGIQDASLNMLVVKMGELYNRRQIISFSAKPNNPTLLMLEKELAQNRNRLNENLRNLIANATKSINSLKDRQNRINFQLNKLPAKEQQMINIQRQYNLTNEIYTFLLQKRAETNIALASSISDVQIIESADPDAAKSISLSGKIILFLGLFLGLAIPAAIILLFNFLDNRILNQEDVENQTQLPILGNIMHSTYGSELTVFGNPKSNIAESFRDLRTNLEFMLTNPQSKVISIHSTNPGEGKSYITINLGTILAMNNNKVLLIGADMRKPKLHKIFNIENKKGLSTHLIGYDTFEQVIFPTEVDNMWVMPSGPIPPNPSEILSKPVMKNLIELARRKFDYIILDNAPVALVTDGIIAGRLSDLNIFILRFGMSHKHQLELINQYADTKKVANIGIIVNDIKANSFGKSYYKYYQYEAYKKTYYTEEELEKKTRRKKKVKDRA